MKLFQKKMTTIEVDLFNECILRSLLIACVLESENFAQVYLVWKKKKKNNNNKKNFWGQKKSHRKPAKILVLGQGK